MNIKTKMFKSLLLINMCVFSPAMTVQEFVSLIDQGKMQEILDKGVDSIIKPNSFFTKKYSIHSYNAIIALIREIPDYLTSKNEDNSRTHSIECHILDFFSKASRTGNQTFTWNQDDRNEFKFLGDSAGGFLSNGTHGDLRIMYERAKDFFNHECLDQKLAYFIQDEYNHITNHFYDKTNSYLSLWISNYMKEKRDWNNVERFIVQIITGEDQENRRAKMSSYLIELLYHDLYIDLSNMTQNAKILDQIRDFERQPINLDTIYDMLDLYHHLDSSRKLGK